MLHNNVPALANHYRTFGLFEHLPMRKEHMQLRITCSNGAYIPVRKEHVRFLLQDYFEARREKALSYKVGSTRYTIFIRYNKNGNIRTRIQTREGRQA
jgi:hypothetical protein